MRKGDISNELPKRILVCSEIFAENKVEVTRKFKIIPNAKVKKTIKREILSFLYLFTTKRGVTLELISFDMDEVTLDKFVTDLDKVGTNPFRYWTSYGSVNQLVKELPYRPEVIGVVDVQSRILRYGHWGMDVSEL